MPNSTTHPPARNDLGWRRIVFVAGLLAMAGASSGASPRSPGGSRSPGSSLGTALESAQQADYEWVSITYGNGIEVDVAIFKPENYSDSGNHPLILALPWGRGTPDLTLGMVDAYWNREASRRGYVVVAPSILGSSLATEADEFLPALFSWLDEHVSYDPERVVVVGASNGGRGVFHVLAADPERFAAAIGMPGSYSGPSETLEPFAGKPVWLMVGEMDRGWQASTEATRATLEAAGITPRVDLIRGQGHVLRLDDRILMD
ncbi:MAG: prolyl oligopeptidase family serine peptidase, partial [Gemmatimonadetes bacterium]|nr:prolyl oligopeptidase family serine peptidase [Gemmatimonadota bacterium]